MRRTLSARVTLVGLAMAARVGAQAPNASQGLPGALQEVTASQGMRTAQLDTLLRQASRAEQEHRWPAAVDDLAVAVVSAPRFSLRDTLLGHLRTVLQKNMQDTGPTSGARLDSTFATLLDRTFQRVYDTQIPVTPAAPATSGRVVLAEEATGTQCGVCWVHDRAFAALLQRYPSSNFVVLAYHDGPGYPIAYGGDSLWSYVTYNRGLYKIKTMFGAGDLGWIDGQAVVTELTTTPSAEGFRINNVDPAAAYRQLAAAIDQRLIQPPEAAVVLAVTPRGVTDTGVAAAQVEVRVTPTVRRAHLGVRLVLVEDTVRVTGFTNRRLQYAAVRTVAWFGHPRSLFFPLPAGVRTPTTVRYTFDVAALQRALLRTWASDADGHAAFSDPHTWHMQPRHLGVVAIVQDLDTKDVLQAAYRRIVPSEK